MQELFQHLYRVTLTDQFPASVGKGIIRDFYIETLKQHGHRSTKFDSDMDLKAQWQQNFWDEEQNCYKIDFLPAPNPYVLYACYSQIFRGIGFFNSTVYSATLEFVLTLGTKREILEKNTSIRRWGRIEKALHVLATYDEVLRKYVRESGDTSLILSLDQRALTAFGDLYQQLPPHHRGLSGATSDLCKAILEL